MCTIFRNHDLVFNGMVATSEDMFCSIRQAMNSLIPAGDKRRASRSPFLIIGTRDNKVEQRQHVTVRPSHLNHFKPCPHEDAELVPPQNLQETAQRLILIQRLSPTDTQCRSSSPAEDPLGQFTRLHSPLVFFTPEFSISTTGAWISAPLPATVKMENACPWQGVNRLEIVIQRMNIQQRGQNRIPVSMRLPNS